jgi:uncharacterized membrane protein YhaH (DUF805 family)
MFTTRIGRLGFLLGYIYLQLPIIALIILYGFANWLSGGNSDVVRSATNVILYSFGVVWGGMYILLTVSLCVRRWHDIDQTGWLTALYLVPFASLVAAIVQLVVPGSAEANRYGEPVTGFGFKKVLFCR